MKRKRSLRKLTALLTVCCLMLEALGLMRMTAYAQEAGEYRIYEYEGYSVAYIVHNRWEGGMQAEMTLTNTSTQTIYNWGIEYSLSGVFHNIWNASVVSQEEDTVLIRHNDYNAAIEPGQSVSFGYVLGSEAFEEPRWFRLMQKKQPAVGDYEVTYNIINDWGNGFQAVLEIQNQTSEPKEGWQLSFDSSVEINNLWGAAYTRNDTGYTLVSHDWSSAIPAGGSVSVGFTGIKDADTEISFGNYELTEVVVNSAGGGEAEPETTESEITESETMEPETTESETIEPEVIDYTLDTDGDGLPDYLEKEYACDANDPDTDKDGLPDGYEIFFTYTDPSMYDTDGDKTPDGREDPDGDGLDNMEEFRYKTEPWNVDTDNDDLSDYDEICVYGTDPLRRDTDKDMVSDLDEILLSLDPLNPQTHGYPDNEYTLKQRVTGESWLMMGINQNEEIPYILTVSMTAAGVAENNLCAQVSGYDAAIRNDAMIGKSAELFYGEGLACGGFTLEFHPDDSVCSSGTGIYAGINEEFEGIKRLNIFRYYEELNMLLPLETFHDEERGVVYTSVESLGTYCLMDMEIWLADIGYSPYEASTVMSMRRGPRRGSEGDRISMSTLFGNQDNVPENVSEEDITLQSSSESECEMGISVLAADNAPPVYASSAYAEYGEDEEEVEGYEEVELFTDKMDIVFVIQGQGESPFAYELQLKSCGIFSQFLFENLPELQVHYLITQGPDRMICSGCITNARDNYDFVSANLDSYVFTRLKPLDAGMSCCFDYAVQNIKCRENGKKAIFWAWNSSYVSNFQYKYYDMYCMPQDDDTILMIMSNYLYEDQGSRWGIVCAELCDKIMDSGVILSPLDELDREPALIASRLYYYFMDKCTENIKDGEFLLSATGLRQVPKWYSYISSMKKLQKIDTDGDGLTDYEEIDIAHPLITVNVTNRKYNFPTLAQCIEAGRGCIQEYGSVLGGFERFGGDIQDYLLNRIRVVPLHSSPLDVDTDGDGFADNIYDENGEIFDWILGSEDYFNLVDPDPLRREVVFQWPVYEGDKKAATMVAGFTEYRNKMTCYHNAIDISAPLGSSVRAAFDGEVIYQTPESSWCYDCLEQCQCGGGLGNHIRIRSQIDGKCYITQYSHLSAIQLEDAINKGGHVMVRAGSEIGEVGEFGYAFGYHLDYLCELPENDSRAKHPRPCFDPLLFDLVQYKEMTIQDKIDDWEYYMNVPKDIRNVCGGTKNEYGKDVHCYNCDDYIEKIRDRYNLR